MLGKRVRDGDVDQDASMESPPKAANNGAEEDDSDDDVGPMPMPDRGPSAGGIKKKRKGMSVLQTLS